MKLMTQEQLDNMSYYIHPDLPNTEVYVNDISKIPAKKGIDKSKYILVNPLSNIIAQFEFIESDDPMLYDDVYQLIEDPNIYIQVNDDFGYIVHILNYEHTESKEVGTYQLLSTAMRKAIWLGE
jgi:hypothetical protein